MSMRKVSFLICGVILVSCLCTGCFPKKETGLVNDKQLPKDPVKQVVQVPKFEEKKYDLYSETPYDLPLFSIAEISKIPIKTKKIIDSILEASQGFYYLKVNDDNNIFVILQNPIQNSNTYTRHNLQFIEIDQEGVVTSHIAGYTGQEGEFENSVKQKDDIWTFDNSVEPYRPIKHIAYDEKGKMKFIETWNYSEEEPIKYQMKDCNKKIISILKESQDNDSNLRREHVFYDNDGNITMSLTVNYDGANISRLTYYNSHDKIDSVSILSEYENGNKVKELIYNEDYEQINTVTADYIDEVRKSIKVLDKDENEVIKISS